MNAEEMTAEQLMELAQAKAAGDELAASSSRVVDIDGVKVTIDVAKLQSWNAFNLIRGIENDENQLSKIDAAMRFVEYVSDFDEEAIVQHCGGDDAAASVVVAFAMRIIQGCYPKN